MAGKKGWGGSWIIVGLCAVFALVALYNAVAK